MKITWEAIDIKPGQRYGRPTRLERWIIGYMPGLSGKSARYCEISLADGAIHGPFSKEELALRLTVGEELPEELL
jgi:hypothetical protein